VSALGHILEERGIATVAIGAVRAQIERTRPPRGLWTTAQLGRPLGEPEDPAHQRRVLMAALGLLERRDGPVILEDFTRTRRDGRTVRVGRCQRWRPAMPRADRRRTPLPEIHRQVSDWLRREAIRELVARNLIDQFRPLLC